MSNRRPPFVSVRKILLAVLLFASPVFANELQDLQTKYSQPLCINSGKGFIVGLDRTSQQPHPDFQIMADDFLAGDGALVALRWWGSYAGVTREKLLDPPDPKKTPPFEENKNTTFQISIYPSIGTHPNSLPAPGAPLYSATVNPFETIVLDGSESAPEATLRYETFLPEPFFQVAGVEYFLSIVKAGPPLAPVTGEAAAWGWHDSTGVGCTDNPPSPIADFAATALNPAGPWTTFTPGTDLAFELFTIPEPSALVLLLISTALTRRNRRQRG